MSLKRYVIRVSGDPTLPVEEHGFYPGACPFDEAQVFNDGTVAAALRYARECRPGSGVWAIEVDVRFREDRRPCFAISAPMTWSCHATALRQTDRALLVEMDGEEVWIPQSVIGEDSEVYEEGHEGLLVVEEWFARREGWT